MGSCSRFMNSGLESRLAAGLLGRDAYLVKEMRSCECGSCELTSSEQERMRAVFSRKWRPLGDHGGRSALAASGSARGSSRVGRVPDGRDRHAPPVLRRRGVRWSAHATHARRRRTVGLRTQRIQCALTSSTSSTPDDTPPARPPLPTIHHRRRPDGIRRVWTPSRPDSPRSARAGSPTRSSTAKFTRSFEEETGSTNYL